VDQAEIQRRLERFEAVCRQQRLPLTVQRREILTAVLARDDHPTADQVYDAVKDRIPALSRTTVYRVLETLVSLGLVRRLHHPGASARFDGKIRRHHHLVCRKCNRIIDIQTQSFDDLNLPTTERHGFEIEDYAVHFIGVCAECRRSVSQ